MHRRSASYPNLVKSCSAQSVLRWIPLVTYDWSGLHPIPGLEGVCSSVPGFGRVRGVALIFESHRSGFLLLGQTNQLDLGNPFESHVHVP